MTRRNPPALSDAEEVVALTRIRVEHLTEALHAEPIDRQTYTELAAFLEGPAWRACDALDELRKMSTSAVLDRIAEVLACTPHAVTEFDTHSTIPRRSAS
jgi:hypothetical protein